MLSLNDIKTVRHAWRFWSNIGARFLFTTYVDRVDRVDRREHERFELVRQHESMLAGIQSVRFESGTMGIEDMCKQLGFVYRSEYIAARQLSTRPDRYTSEELEIAKDLAIQEFAAWNTHWHEAKQDFTDGEKMKTMLATLKTLRRVDVVRAGAASTFTSKLLAVTWMRKRDFNDFKRASKEFETLLSALKHTPSKIRHLTHDQLPVTFFSLEESVLGELTSSLQNLTVLRLTINASVCPHARCWSGLGHFLRSIPGLKKLRFGFDPFEMGNVECGTWVYDVDDLLEWYLPLWKMLGEYTWKDLAVCDWMVSCSVKRDCPNCLSDTQQH